MNIFSFEEYVQITARNSNIRDSHIIKATKWNWVVQNAWIFVRLLDIFIWPSRVTFSASVGCFTWIFEEESSFNLEIWDLDDVLCRSRRQCSCRGTRYQPLYRNLGWVRPLIFTGDTVVPRNNCIIPYGQRDRMITKGIVYIPTIVMRTK